MKAILFICSTLLMGVTVYADGDGDFQNYMTKAGQAFKEQDAKQALGVLIKAAPLANSAIEKIKVNNAMGWTYFSEGDNEKAREHLQQALQLAIKNDNARLAEKASNNLGIVEYTAGNLDAAEEYFLNKWAKNSETSANYLKLIEEQRTLETVNKLIAEGVVFVLDSKYQDAIMAYDKALQIDPKNIRALEYKGYAQYRLKNYDDAIVSLKQAQAINPNDLNVLINLLKSYCSSDKKMLAKQFIEDNKTFLATKITLLNNDGELQKACGSELFLPLQEAKSISETKDEVKTNITEPNALEVE